jgi:hypothetical protein
MKKTTILTIATAAAILAAVCITHKSQADTESPEAQIAKLQRQLAAAKAEITKLMPYAKRGAQMPIKLEQRKAVMASGRVLEVENYSSDTLPVKVMMISPTFGKTNAFDLVLDPAQIRPFVKEIGHMQGWTLAPGDVVEVHSKDYLPSKTLVQ